MRLLLVQSDRSAGPTLPMLLTKMGHEVDCCDGSEGAARCAAIQPDVVLLDLLPVVSIQVCQTIRGDAATRGVPVIVLSARPTRDQVLKSVQAGASSFIDKGSMTPEVIEEKIKKVTTSPPLAQKAARQEPAAGPATQSAQPRPAAAPAPSPTAPPPPGLKIVVMTPKKHLAVLLQREMKAFDLTVETYSEQLFQQILAAPPHVVLIDDSLKDALRVAGQLAKKLPSLGLVLISRVMTRDKVLGAARVGVQGILVYPFSTAMLLDSVRRAFDKAGNKESKALVPRGMAEAGLGSTPVGEEVMRELLEVDSVRSLPHIIERVLFITDDETSGATELEEVILSDANAASVVLRKVNSAYYAADREITRVRDAITRMGFQEVRSLVMTLSVIDSYGLGQEQLAFDRLGFWKSSLATAFMARELARHLGLKSLEVAFLGGLLADFGKMLLDEHLRERFEEAIALCHEKVIRLTEAEKRVLGVDHNQVAVQVLAKWGFPQAIVELIETHEELSWPEGSGADENMSTIIGLAKWIALMLGVGDNSEIVFEYPPVEVLERSNLESFLTDELIDRMREELGGLLSYFKVQLDWPPVPADKRQPMYYWEPLGVPLSPLQLAIRRVGGSPVQVADAAAISELEPGALALVHFPSAGQLKQEAREREWGSRPWLFLLPRGQVPADDALKERVGLPVGNCRYRDHPCSLRELAGDMAELGH